MGQPPQTAADIRLEKAFPTLSFEFPIALAQAPGEPGRWFVAERSGLVRVIDNTHAAPAPSTFIDLRDRVDSSGEGGLLGMAFHPRFQENGEVFLSYTGPGSPLISYVSRFVSTDGGATLEPGSEEPLVTVNQPFANHNGGHIAFGPDGYLYIGFGDGGGGGDPLGNGQNTSTLFGALLRIDVDSGEPYGIPPDNPFVDGGGRGEIYAWGLRNPWRWSFDRATGSLWLGDVGQREWEEVDCVRRGGNYGWNIREGTHCFEASACDTTGLVDPVTEYSHELGCSITGGFVYRGSAIPALRGGYLYGDFCTGRIWALFLASSGTPVVQELLDSDQRILSFAERHDGELFVLTTDNIFRLLAN